MRLRRGGVLLLLLSCGSIAGCAARSAQPAAVAPPPRPAATAFPDDPRPLPRYRSKRLALSLPLPSGRDWRIDDHSRPELVALHEATRSRIVIAVVRADELVGRQQCEKLARDRKLVPLGDLQTLEDEVTITQQTFDTRIRVALEPGMGGDRPLIGHVLAFGGFLRKCFIFAFSTEVEAAAEEPVLSSRLAFARARILGGLELDSFATVQREQPSVPGTNPGAE